MATISLLYPEWQSYGETTCVYRGALKLAEALSVHTQFVRVEVPAQEVLEKIEGVLGLHSIGPRFKSTLSRLRAEAPKRIFMVGGTCGVEVAPVGYLNECYSGDLAVLWFDAHGDLNTASSSPSGHFHGMALRTLLGEGPEIYTQEFRRHLRPEQVFLVGSRDLDPPEIAYISQQGISVTSLDEMSDIEKLVALITERKFTRVYLHLDLDVINPESFPDSLMQTPGGPTINQVSMAIRHVAQHLDIVGFSVVEYCEHQGNKLDSLIELVENSGITKRWN